MFKRIKYNFLHFLYKFNENKVYKTTGIYRYPNNKKSNAILFQFQDNYFILKLNKYAQIETLFSFPKRGIVSQQNIFSEVENGNIYYCNLKDVNELINIKFSIDLVFKQKFDIELLFEGGYFNKQINTNVLNELSHILMENDILKIDEQGELIEK